MVWERGDMVRLQMQVRLAGAASLFYIRRSFGHGRSELLELLQVNA